MYVRKVSKVFQGCVKEVSKSFKEVSRNFQVCFKLKKVSRSRRLKGEEFQWFQGNLKEVKWNFKGVSSVFQVSF